MNIADRSSLLVDTVTDMSGSLQHMDINIKCRRQSYVKQDIMLTSLHSSCGTLSTSLQESKGCEEAEEHTWLSCRVVMHDLQDTGGRDDDLELCNRDYEAPDAISTRTRQRQRRSELLSRVVVHDHQKARDVYQPVETECQATVTSAKGVCQSSSMKYHAVNDQSQQSTAYTAICTDSHPSSEPMIKSPLSAGTTYRLLGRSGKRRSGTFQHRGHDHSLQPCDGDCKVTNDHLKVQPVLLDCQLHRRTGIEDRTTRTSATKARRSSSRKRHAVDDQSQQSNCEAHNTVSKEIEQGQRHSELSSGEVTYDCQKARDVHLDRRLCQHAETEDHTTVTPAKQARHSSSRKLCAVSDQNQRNDDLELCNRDYEAPDAISTRTRQRQRCSELLSGVVVHDHQKARDVYQPVETEYQAVSADLYPSCEEPMIKNPASAGCIVRSPGRISKHRPGARQQSVSYSSQYCFIYLHLMYVVYSYNQATGYASRHIWCLSQARINCEGCARKGI